MSTAFKSADILLPKNADMSNGQWLPATSIPLSLSIGLTWKDNRGCKSALNLILPEVYLEDDNVDERIADIHKNMDSYISEGVLKSIRTL